MSPHLFDTLPFSVIKTLFDIKLLALSSPKLYFKCFKYFKKQDAYLEEFKSNITFVVSKLQQMMQ